MENLALSKAFGTIVHVRENPILASKLIRVVIHSLQHVEVGVLGRQRHQVSELGHSLTSVNWLLIQDAQSFAGLILQRLVRDDVVLATRAIIQIGLGHRARSPGVIALRVLGVAWLRHHLVVNSLEAS